MSSTQMTTSATPEDDVIRPMVPVTLPSPASAHEAVASDAQSPSEAEGKNDTTSSEKKPWVWPKPTLEPKHDRPPSLSGFKLVLSWIRRSLVFIARVLTLGFKQVRRISNPKLNKRDALHYAIEAELQRQLEELRMRLERLKRNAVHRPRTVTIVNSKGGSGKTPTATYLGVFAQEYTGNACTLIDINQNFGTTWRRVGVSQADTITVYAALTSAPFGHIDEFNAVTAIHYETGLRFIGSEDMDTTAAVGQILNLENVDLANEEVQRKVFRRFKAFIQNIKRFSHSVFIDTGNGMSHASHIAAVNAADVLVLPANWSDDDDIAGIQETVHGYINRGYGPKLRQRAFYAVFGAPDLKKEVIYEQFCDRVFAAYVAAKFKKGTLEAMDPQYREQKTREYVDNLGITIDRLYLVPWSSYIAEKNVAASAVIDKVGMPTSLAITHVLDDIYGLNIDTDPAEVESSIDIEGQLTLLYQQMQPEDAQLALLQLQVQTENDPTTA